MNEDKGIIEFSIVERNGHCSYSGRAYGRTFSAGGRMSFAQAFERVQVEVETARKARERDERLHSD